MRPTARRWPLVPHRGGGEAASRSIAQDTHRGGDRIDFVGFPHTVTGLFLCRFRLNHPDPFYDEGTEDGGTVAIGSLDGRQDFICGVPADPCNGALHAGLGDGECFAAGLGSGGRGDERVGVGARLGIDADDVVVFLCHDDHDGDPSFPSIVVTVASSWNWVLVRQFSNETRTMKLWSTFYQATERGQAGAAPAETDKSSSCHRYGTRDRLEASHVSRDAPILPAGTTRPA